MKRFLPIIVFCMFIVACGSSKDDAGSSGTGLDPTAMKLDSPPTDGNLPAELLPPA